MCALCVALIWLIASLCLSGSSSFADITTDIAMMENMRAQLKRIEREKNVMKIQYEEKLAQQQQRIRQTEIERDQVLATLGTSLLIFTLLTPRT